VLRYMYIAYSVTLTEHGENYRYSSFDACEQIEQRIQGIQK